MNADSMIKSFKHRWLKDFFIDDKHHKKIPAEINTRLFRKLQIIDDARTDQDLRVPLSNQFEKLSGNLDGRHSIRVNIQWRLIFYWNGGNGEAGDIYLDNHDYH